MGLETGTYLNNLVETNPLTSDAKSQGDDHLRLIKSVLKATFPGMAGRISRVQSKSSTYTVATTDNLSVINATTALTLNLPAAATVGNGFSVAVFASGGAVTLDPNSTEQVNGATTYQLVSGAFDLLFCDGTAWYTLLNARSIVLAALTVQGIFTVPDTLVVQDNSDATKQFQLQLSGITAGQTRVMTIPDQNFTPSVLGHTHGSGGEGFVTPGPNWLANGNFEQDLANWTKVEYSGGTVATGTSTETEGTRGLVITASSGANGGGYVRCDEFIPVIGGQQVQFMLTCKASNSGCRIQAYAEWYDDAQVRITDTDILPLPAASPTSDKLVVKRLTAPSTARYVKVVLLFPSGGSIAGTVYFDRVIVTTPHMLGGMKVITSSGAFGDDSDEPWGDIYAEVYGGGGGGGGAHIVGTSGLGANGGAAGGVAEGWVQIFGSCTVTIGAGGSGGTSSPSSGSQGGTTTLAATSGNLTATGGEGGASNNGVTGAYATPGVGTGGTLNGSAGGCGLPAFSYNAVVSGAGGSSRIGLGGYSLLSSANGIEGGRAAGGSGGLAGVASRVGGAGGPGQVTMRW